MIFLHSTFYILHTAPLWGAGLASRFSVVTIDNLQPGVTYNVQEAVGMPLAVINKSGEKVTVRIDAQKPQFQSRPEFEPIPDISWVRLEKNEFEIKAGEEKGTNVFLTIPDDERLLGKKFQVNFWSRTIGAGIQLGLMGSLRFEIAKSRLSPEDLNRHVNGIKNRTAWAMKLTPLKAVLSNVVPGRLYDAEHDGGAVFAIANLSEKKLVFNLSVKPFAETEIEPAPDYADCPHPSWLKVPAKIKVRRGRSAKVPLKIQLPDDKNLSGYRFSCAIEATVEGAPVDYRRFSQVFVEIKR
ncbi:MAG: hypothetical protein HY747_03815 [Elusimicrobia bacterium]|nr:hypothetical protein [Elusimicrobiota bacterium]